MLGTLWNTLTPFLWGGALALVLNIPLRWVERRLCAWPGLHAAARRGLALADVLVGFAALLALGVWLLAPQLLAAVADLATALPQLGASLQRLLGGDSAARMTASLADLGGTGSGWLDRLWAAGMTAVQNAAGALGRFFLALVLAVYLLAGKETAARKARLLCTALLGKNRAARLIALGQQSAAVFSDFVAGQCLEACILAGLFVLALLLFRMPYVLPISAVIGVTALMPVFGAWLGCGVGVLLILPLSPEKAVGFVVLFVCVQQFENNVIYPRVVGRRIGLPPLWVMGAVLLGGGLFGAAGLLLGIPAVSVLYHVGGDWARARLAETHAAGLDSHKKM